jgi:hypothetical protein
VVTEAGTTVLRFLEAPSNVRSASETGGVEVRVPGNQSYAVDVSTVGMAQVSVIRDPAAAHHITVRAGIGGVRVAPA